MKKAPVTNNAIPSAAPIASQTPLTPKNNGNSSSIQVWNTSVRRKEITAEITPFPNAVKNADPKILNPESKKDNAYLRNPPPVSSHSSGSYPTKIFVRGDATA